jgi:phosphohistidine phosphatase
LRAISDRRAPVDLILWRHCHALDGVPDDARPLSPRGLKEAAEVARRLAPQLPASCRIVVSPALRAQQTAQALHRPFDTVVTVGTGASVASVLRAARWPHAPTAVLVVGHQPTLGCVASLLLEGDEHERPMRAGEVLWIRGDETDPVHAVLTQTIAPDRA